MALKPEAEALAGMAANGDADALNALLTCIRPHVLRHCGRILPCFEDAEEACQDALLQVAQHVHRFEGRSKFSTWLHIVVTNCARQTYRSLKRRAAERTNAELLVEHPDPRTTSVIAGFRIDLLDALERLEAHRPALAHALILRDLCQLDYDEIAAELGIPAGTAKSQVHRARRHVRNWLNGG
ncbi:RNA polymerase sigma factor [Micromonospora sp. C51]|uniref:RNA polymerase sigma factor n=1 Tax=Micromonospora sp. C51 TaxID=2824879 RepID=UPI001B382FDB|nr:RNA polymerase sigma factor [Micromonospora sp. C51]MBQ1051879.1 RNA polymerase sigma factor [Micromonospora sp. C51]